MKFYIYGGESREGWAKIIFGGDVFNIKEILLPIFEFIDSMVQFIRNL